MNVDPADLMTDPADRPPVPTFYAYVPQVEEAVSPGAAKNFGSYWNRIRAKWGSRTLLEPTPTEIKHFAEETKANAVQRRNSRGGSSRNSALCRPSLVHRGSVNTGCGMMASCSVNASSASPRARSWACLLLPQPRPDSVNHQRCGKSCVSYSLLL